MEIRREEIGDGTRWVVKVSSTIQERNRVARERDCLRQAAHPGVVELGPSVGAGDDLRTREVDGPSLAELGPLTSRELAGLGSAAATILADLHDIGIAHGAVRADHLLIASDGRPVLCSLAASGPVAAVDPADDVTRLAGALAEHLPPDSRGRLPRLLRSVAGGGRRTPSARVFASAIRSAVPAWDLPRPADHAFPADHPHRADHPHPTDHPQPTDHPGDHLPTPTGGDVPGGPARAEKVSAAQRAPDPWARGQRGSSPVADDILAVAGLARHPLRLAPTADEKRPDQTKGVAPTAADGRGPRRWARSREARAGRFATVIHGRSRRRIGIAGAVALCAAVACTAVLGHAVLDHAVLEHRAPPPPVASSSGAVVPCPAVDAGCGPLRLIDGRFTTASGSFAIDLPSAVVVIGRWSCRPQPLAAALDPSSGTVWLWPAWAAGGEAVAARRVAFVPGATTAVVRPGPAGCDQLLLRTASHRWTVLRLAPPDA